MHVMTIFVIDGVYMTLEDSAIDIQKVIRILQSHRAFNVLTRNEIESLCSSADYIQFKTGEALIKEEKPNQYLYLLLDGKVHIKSYGIKIRSVSSDALIGEISAAGLGSVADDAATAEAVAACDVQTVRFPASELQKLAQHKQEFAESLHDAAMSRLFS